MMNEWVIPVIALVFIFGCTAVGMVAYRSGQKDSAAEIEIQKNIAYGQGYTNGYRGGKQDLLKELREVQLINEGEYDTLSGECL